MFKSNNGGGYGGDRAEKRLRMSSICAGKLGMIRRTIATFFILGDLNCNLLRPSEPEPKAVLDFCNCFSLTQVINKPTKITQLSTSLFDVIFTNNKYLIMETKVVAHSISDHELIIATLNLKKPRPKPSYITTRSFQNYNKVAFLEDISNAPWSVIGVFDDVEDKLNAFNTLFNQVLDQHVPVKTVKMRTRPCPFINDNIRALMKARDHWQKLARRTNDPAVWSGYKNFRNEVKRELRLAQKAFVEGQIRQNVNDTNTMWKTIRSCMPKKSASAKSFCKDDKTMATEFNQFFTSAGKTTLAKIQSLADECGYLPTHASSAPIQYPLSEQFTFRNVECCEIDRVVKSLANNKAPGTDKIPCRVIKESAPVIIPSITSIINSPITTVGTVYIGIEQNYGKLMLEDSSKERTESISTKT